MTPLLTLLLAASPTAASPASGPVWRKPESMAGFRAMRIVAERRVREDAPNTRGVQHLCAVVEDPTGQNRDSVTMPVTAWLYWPGKSYLLAFSRSAFAPWEEPVGSAMQSIDLKHEVFARAAVAAGSIRGVSRSVPDRIIAACRAHGTSYTIENRRAR